MTRRVLTAALAASLALPATAAAQMEPVTFGEVAAPRFQLTPFVAYLNSFTRQEEWTFPEGGAMVHVATDYRVGSGPGAGLIFEMPVRGLVGITTAAGFASRRESTVVLVRTGEAYRVDGANVVFARLGAALQMPREESELVLRRLAASVFAGGIVMHERPRNSLGIGSTLGSATHFGANVGVSAELPFARDRFAVQVGIENNMMFWNEGRLAVLPHEFFAEPGSPQSQTTVSADMSHAWLFRAGLSFRIP